MRKSRLTASPVANLPAGNVKRLENGTYKGPVAIHDAFARRKKAECLGVLIPGVIVDQNMSGSELLVWRAFHV